MLDRLEPSGVIRASISAHILTLLYFFRCACGVPSMNALPDLLFCDKGLMLRLGFNARQLEEGLTQRGAGRRQGERANLPLDPEMLSNTVARYGFASMRQAMVDFLKLIWKSTPDKPRRIMMIIDGTLIELGESAVGGGWTKRQEKIKTAAGLKTIDRSFYGYKLVWAYEPSTGLPLGMAFGTADQDEKHFTDELLGMAGEILGGLGKVHKVALDKGYFSGPLLYELDRAGLLFVTPAKAGTNIREEALNAAGGGGGFRTHRARRQDGRGHDVEVVGIEGLETFSTYAPASKVKDGEHVDRHKKDFQAKKINAVVLVKHSGYKHPDMVVLTNGPVRNPFGSYDDYDDRSLSENKNRCLKQDFKLCRSPQRNYEAACVHCHFVVMAFAAATGHMRYLEEQERLAGDGKPSTLGSYYRRTARENRDQVIVFYENKYGIFYLSELMLLRGIAVKRPPRQAAKTVEDIFSRSGVPDTS